MANSVFHTFFPRRCIFHDLCNNLSSAVSRFELYRLLAGVTDRCSAMIISISMYIFILLTILILHNDCDHESNKLLSNDRASINWNETASIEYDTK